MGRAGKNVGIIKKIGDPSSPSEEEREYGSFKGSQGCLKPYLPRSITVLGEKREVGGGGGRNPINTRG